MSRVLLCPMYADVMFLSRVSAEYVNVLSFFDLSLFMKLNGMRKVSSRKIVFFFISFDALCRFTAS